MDAGKRPSFHLLGGSNEFGRLIAARLPAAQATFQIEEKITGCLTLLHCQRCQSLRLDVKLLHALKIDRAQHINVVQ